MEVNNGMVQQGGGGTSKTQLIGDRTLTDSSEMAAADVTPGMTSWEAEKKVEEYRKRPGYQAEPGGGWDAFVMIFLLILPAFITYKALNDSDVFGPMLYVYLWTPFTLVFLFKNGRRLYRAFKDMPKKVR